MTTALDKPKAPVRPRPFGVLDGVCLLALLFLALLLALTALVPPVLGLTPYAVTSDSMSPTLRRGDLVFARPAGWDELEVGNVIVFQINGAVLTHRIYEMDREAGVLRTRADASPFLDPYQVEAGQILGRAVYKVPLLGFLGGKEGAG